MGKYAHPTSYKLEKEMHNAAKILDFEKAAEIRDRLKELRELVKNR